MTDFDAAMSSAAELVKALSRGQRVTGVALVYTIAGQQGSIPIPLESGGLDEIVNEVNDLAEEIVAVLSNLKPGSTMKRGVLAAAVGQDTKSGTLERAFRQLTGEMGGPKKIIKVERGEYRLISGKSESE